LLRLPLAALSNGDIAAVQDAMPEFGQSPTPVLLVCTNSRRDVCCAVRGRPVALESSSRRPGQVWECSHTGGHRFAPTGVLLPHGQTYARISGPSAVLAVDAATRGEVPAELMGTAYDRGRSHLTPPAQAAESVVRQHIQEPGLLALSTTAAPRRGRDDAWDCQVSHVDGRGWDVVAVRSPGAQDRPESCGKPAVPTWAWDCKVD
jgi:Sucrase/ferredoxin-like